MTKRNPEEGSAFSMRESGQQPAENKLLLLYAISEKGHVSEIELSDFVLFHGYMDYFVMQTMLKELETSELITNDHGDCRLTESGRGVLETFIARIPNSIRCEIRDYAKTSVYSKASMLEADCRVTAEGDHFKVECLIIDYDKVRFTLTKEVKTEAECWQIKNRWLTRGMTIYRSLIASL